MWVVDSKIKSERGSVKEWGGSSNFMKAKGKE